MYRTYYKRPAALLGSRCCKLRLLLLLASMLARSVQLLRLVIYHVASVS
jgi:hypothetical protein